MSARKGLEQWHRTMKSGNRPEDLEKIIHDLLKASFNSELNLGLKTSAKF